jgi:hypothetical protein
MSRSPAPNENFILNVAVSQDMKEEQEDRSVSEPTEEATPQQRAEQADETLEQGPEPYPLRNASEDPRWAVRIVWIWVGTAVFLLLFLITLLILGYWYD